MSRGKKKELSVQERCEIIAFHNTKFSIRKIAELTGHTKSTVHYTIARFKNTNSCENLARSGRPKAVTERDRRYLKLCALRDRRKSLSILLEDFNGGRKTPVSHSVVNRALHSWSLIGRVAARKPLLSSRNVKKRLAFAKEHVKWGKRRWEKVLFTDESKFELFGTHRRTFVRRLPNERFVKQCLTATVKHGGGSVMVWGGICTNGVTPLKKIEGIMDKKMYHSILVHRAIPQGKRLIGKGFIFQEDNDPKHASNLCRNYLQNKEKSGTIILYRLQLL